MTYDFDGKKYEKASFHQQEWGNKLISELNLFGNEKILDLGCGNGTLTANLADLVPNGSVLGIDASQGMLDVARYKKRDNLTFKLMDINKLELSGKYDVIFSNATLHWIKDHQSLWKNVKNLLSEQGIVRFNFAADGNCQYFFRTIHKAMMLDEYKKFFKHFEWPWYMPSIEEYKKLVKPFSLSEIKIWGEKADYLFPDSESIVGWINQPSIVPFLKLLPENQKELFRNFVIEQMLKNTAQENGGYFETFRRINIYAKNANA